MRIEPLPTKADALRLLREIAALPAACAPRPADKPLMLYGAGNLGRMAKQLLDHIGIPVRAVVDANAERFRDDPFWRGIPVFAPAEVPVCERNEALLAVTIANLPYKPIAAQLAEQGWPDVAKFYDVAEAYRDRHPLGNGWFAGELDDADLAHIDRVLDRWADDQSRAHHLQFLAWRRLRQDWTFRDAPVVPDDRFFIPEVRCALTDDEAFADLGAHTGSTCQAFIDAVGGRFRHIWAVEPDAENRAALDAMLAELPEAMRQRIEVLPVAVGHERGMQRFVPGLGYASQCSELGRMEVPVETVDALGLAPTFIKLHLEGAEMDALAGARETLRTHRPMIVATSYHNRLGLWALPDWLRGELPGYRFHLRLHSWCGTGSVIYCIPEERAHAAP